MAGARDPVQEFHLKLSALYRAAGEPTHDLLARRTKVSDSTLNDWLTGKAIPSNRTSLETLVGVLKGLAGAGCPPDPVGGWETLRVAAAKCRRPGQRPGRGERRPAHRMLGPVPPVADCYQDRPEAAQLEAAAAGGTAVLGQLLVGMGGVGKTQLAARYARTAYDERRVEVLVWVTAASREAVTAAYADAAAQILSTDPADPQAAAMFREWLRLPPGERGGPTPGARWLIVLDDIPDPGAVRGLWPPDVAHGQTVVTTRNQDAAFQSFGRNRIDIGLYTPDQASAYVTEKLAQHGRIDDPHEICGLASDMGYLPLALSQAIPFMINRKLDCAAYRRRLADRAKTLTHVLPPEGGLPDEQSRTVAAAWEMSIELADQQPPQGLARPLLHLIALLDPNGIPAPVLKSAPVLTHLATHRTPSPHIPTPEDGAAVDHDDTDDALANLEQFSLLSRTPDTSYRAVHIHQLIQRAVHELLPPDYRHHCGRTAADALMAAWPAIERDTALAQALRANTEALTRHAEAALHRPKAHSVLFRTGRSLGESGQFTAAVAHFRHLSQVADIDPGTLIAAHDSLARWQGKAGDSAGAAAAYERLLELMRPALGPDAPQTLTTESHLADWRGRAGDATGAVTAYEQLVKRRQRVQGPDHPDTFLAQGSLADWRGRAGDATGAAAAFEELLEQMQRVHGPDHPDALAAGLCLADWRGRAGDVAGAVTAFEELLEQMQGVHGPDHLDTLRTRIKLVGWRGRAGDATGAAAAFEELLEQMQRVHGPDHPDTLGTCSELARWRGRAGDPTGAAAAYETLAAAQERVLAPDHPGILIARSHLAYWRVQAGDTAGAAAAFEELLEQMQRVHGPDHPDTLLTRGLLAEWRGRAGDATGAAAAFEELLELMQRVHGPDHPDTLRVQNLLAKWRGEAGDMAGAVTAYEALATAQERVQGPDHPDTFVTRGYLANARGDAGDIAGAVTAYEQLLEQLLRVFGPDHPYTITARSNLDYCRGQIGNATAHPSAD
ncbi:tetratricopeptide repeat protein [Streptomyces xanthophaeus]|uniref:ATP-binding protein n=1 Tax=Streptomyces xanthophaeus TaxID=67385 RepID=A0A919LD40_9ACTN|nr:tetratricopeptide repeat protein [Streptomyces xanthophaeus]GHI90438.1 ATP-binding protein [Streptomyces xanthophaeus]